MTLINPFHGITYDLAKVGSLGKVCAPPYDVIDDAEKRRLRDLSPYNSVRLILPDDEAGMDRYAAARARLERWLEEGILVVGDSPAVYPYVMSHVHPARGPIATRGIIAAVSLDDRHSVVPHEKTLDAPLGEQMRLLEATRANLSPIYLLAVPKGEATGPVTGIAAAEWPLLGRCEEPSGIEHTLGRIDDPGVVAELQERLEGCDLVIADGHHRYEVARSYYRRSGSLGADKIMALVVDLEEASHSIEGTHRLVAPGSAPSGAELARRLADAFDSVDEVPGRLEALYQLLEEHRVVLVLPGGPDSMSEESLRILASRPLPHDHAEESAAHLPASVVHDTLLRGIPPSEIAYEPSLENAVAAVSKGDAAAAILLPPPPLEAVTAVARSGGLLPQKSTYFHPKPRTGAVFRLLDL